MSRSDAEILDREGVDDLDAILAVTNTEVDEALHVVADNADAIFTWDYEKGARPALNKLYEKAKHSMWNGETDLDWSIEPVNGLSGIVIRRSNQVVGVIGLGTADDVVSDIWIVLNPDKLRHWP